MTIDTSHVDADDVDADDAYALALKQVAFENVSNVSSVTAQ